MSVLLLVFMVLGTMSYINQQDGTSEEASSYGLAIQNYSTSSAFFDYDKDGDLDMYLLNHGIHNTSNFFELNVR